MRVLQLALLAALAGFLFVDPEPARADTVPLESTYFTVGPSGVIGAGPLAPLTLTTAGALSVTVSPFTFGGPLSSLEFEVVDANGHQYDLVSGNGTKALTDSLNLAAGTYFALSFGQTVAKTGAASVGFYGLSAVFTPTTAVPIPTAAALLASALAGLGLWRRGEGGGGRVRIAA